ncbi:hypothetical protein [Streptomyces chartreusis]|uniref:hypothetical protein n=1 Tax=Streptomyces chartreusis TaxID=1969 RepID=UPI00380CF5AB
MGYRLRRWFEDRLPQEISSGERVVALAVADLVWDDSRIGYGATFMAKLLHRTGFENEAQLGKVLGKLAARGIELRVPICGTDGKPLTNKRGQYVYAHRGHQRTFRVPLASEFTGRPAPYWDDEGEKSPDQNPHAWHDGERSPARETITAQSSPAREGIEAERSPSRETNRGERSPARESKVTQAGDPIPLTTTTYLPPAATPNSTTPHGPAGSERDEALTAAVDFLRNLPAPWAIGRVTATAMAPQLLDAITEQGWHLDEQLTAKLTENPDGIKRHSSVLRLRINDLPKAAQQTATQRGPSLPTWCGHCGDGNPAAEFNAKFRTEPGSKKPCHNCHPDHHTADAA